MAYPVFVAALLHGGVAAAGVAAAVRRRGGLEDAVRALGRAAAAVAAATLGGAIFGVALSLVAPMRWYALGIPGAVGLFAPPALLAVTEVGATPAGALFYWSLLLGAGAVGRVGSAYAALAPTLGLLVENAARRRRAGGRPHPRAPPIACGPRPSAFGRARRRAGRRWRSRSSSRSPTRS